MRYHCQKGKQEEPAKIDAITGRKTKTKITYKYCFLARLNNELCGPDAKYWAPKHKKDLFRAITK